MSALHNIVSYWVSSFKLPSSVLKELERLFSNFSWNNKMHAWGWNELCRPKMEGGCGIKKLYDINQVFGVKVGLGTMYI